MIVVGGTLALSACDQIHVHAGVLSYSHPAFAGQAWWVPLQFALATLAICAGAWPFGVRLPEPSGRDLARAAAWFVGAYAASAAFQRWPIALAVVYAVTWLIRVGLAPRSATVALYSLLLAAAGTGAEAAISSTGAFAYARPDALLVPIWLPGLYLHGAPLALALTRSLASPRAVTGGPSPGEGRWPRPA
jgi:hypothetical protein